MSCGLYLDLLRTLVHVILSLTSLFHQLSVLVLLHLLFVLQVGNLLALVFHLPARTHQQISVRHLQMDTEVDGYRKHEERGTCVSLTINGTATF